MIGVKHECGAPRTPGMNVLARFGRFAPVVAVALVASAALPTAVPAADDVSQVRNVAGFDRIRLDGAFAADVTVGGRQRVTVSAAPDLLDHITTDVEGRTLHVGMKGNSTFGHAPKVTIVVPDLRGFANDGASKTEIRGVHGGDFAIENSGAAIITARGRAASASITLNGTGKVDTTDLYANDVTVDNNGFGIVNVRAHGVLTMNVNGLGAIGYTGDPAHIESHINGLGHIGKL
jgi:hypothetical protein